MVEAEKAAHALTDEFRAIERDANLAQGCGASIDRALDLIARLASAMAQTREAQ